MTQSLNYTTKAIDDMMALAKISPNKERKKGFLFVADLLRRAEVFVLPEMGQLIDRSKPYPEVPATIYRPSFPVVALEYSSTQNDWRPTSIFNAASCSKRIALAWEWDGRTPLGPSSELDPRSAVVIASISYFDHVRRWVPICAGIMVRYDTGYVDSADTEMRDIMIRDRRISAKQSMARALDVQHILPILPDAMAALFSQEGPQVALNTISADLMDEVNAYRDLSLALACNNVRPVRNAQPERLNKSRIRMGRPPLKDFHVLEITGHNDVDGGAFGAGGGVRSHLRRGHIRRLSPDRITWVNACMVRGSRPGFLDKQYAAVPGGTAFQ